MFRGAIIILCGSTPLTQIPTRETTTDDGSRFMNMNYDKSNTPRGRGFEFLLRVSFFISRLQLKFKSQLIFQTSVWTQFAFRNIQNSFVKLIKEIARKTVTSLPGSGESRTGRNLPPLREGEEKNRLFLAPNFLIRNAMFAEQISSDVSGES